MKVNHAEIWSPKGTNDGKKLRWEGRFALERLHSLTKLL